MKTLTFKSINKNELTQEVWSKFNPHIPLEMWDDDGEGWEELFFGAFSGDKLVAFVGYTSAYGGKDLILGELPEEYVRGYNWSYICSVASILPGAGKAVINALQSQLLTPVVLEAANTDLIKYYDGLGFKELIENSFYLSRGLGYEA